jgi:hypothetical protein
MIPSLPPNASAAQAWATLESDRGEDYVTARELSRGEVP